MESTTYKTLITFDFGLESVYNNINFQDMDINTILTMNLSEGHQYSGIAKCFAEAVSWDKRDSWNLFTVGNYTKSHKISMEHNMGRIINLFLIPIGDAPFSTFSKYSGCVDTDSVVEPSNEKTEKVSFIYYGHRIDRDIIISALVNNNLLNKSIIYHSGNKQNDKVSLSYSTPAAFKKYNANFEDYEKIQHLLPITDNPNFKYQEENYYTDTIKKASDSLFYIINESNSEMNDKNVNIVTEKSAIPFYSKSIPIIFSTNPLEQLEYFEKLGFDCFTDVIDKSFYKKSHQDRINSMIEIINNTDLDFYKENIMRFKSNYILAKYYQQNYLNSGLETLQKTIQDYNLKVVETQ
tara:strand:- start:1534 stop:2586 length:1053 start_codon:yes stop_codon:yes gene_type:complete